MSAEILVSPASHAIDVKRSRFVAHAAPVSTPDEAIAFLRQVETRAATHNCWAWRIGADYRSSDDGEPAGTAGRPILAAIDGQGLDRAMVVVTRWFGGIKLGAGGLVRAYGGAAAECLRQAERAPRVDMAGVRLHATFDDLGIVHNILHAAGTTKTSETYDAEGAWLVVTLPVDAVAGLETKLRDATRDRVRFEDD